MFTLLYWIFCFSFAFDFRGDEGGSVVQYLFLAAALGSGGLLIVTSPKAFLQKPVFIMSVVWWGYLVTTALVMLEARVSVSQYIRCVLPPALCGLGILIGQAMAARRYTIEMMLRPLLWAGIASVIWRFFHAVFIKGISISMVRYEILSPAVPLLFACAIASAVLAKRMHLLSVFGGALALTTVIVSITRSFIFTAGAACLAVLIAFGMMVSYKAFAAADLRKKVLHFGIGGGLMIMVLLGVVLTQPIVAERWMERLFNDGGGRTVQDVTYLTRAAEAKAMFVLLEADPMRFLYGKGLGANYYWDQSYFPELLRVYGNAEFIGGDYWFPGHSVWTYSLFSGGAFAVCCYLFLFGWMIVMGLSSGSYALKTGAFEPALAFLPFIIGLCYFSQTLTSNPFGERFSAQILGLCAAMPQFFLAQKFSRQKSPLALDLSSSSIHVSTTTHRPG
jgi:hypothetical protein